MMKHARQRRTVGFTLAEMLVVAFLAGVVLFLLAQLLVPSAILFRMQTAKADVHQGGLVFTYWVQRHLSNSALDTVTITPWPKVEGATVPGPPAISFREVLESDPYDAVTGAAKFQARFRVLYFDEPGHRIVVREWPPTPPNLTFDFEVTNPRMALSPPDLSQICGSLSDTDRVLVKNVESLVITDADDDLTHLTPPLSLTVTCAEEGRDQRSAADDKHVEHFKMTARVTPRNTRW